MKTAEEAIAFFQSKGFPASPYDWPMPGAVRVSARQVEGGVEYYGEDIAILQGTFVLLPDQQGWILRDCNWQRDIDERFGSLDEAASAIVEHLAEWLASEGKPMGPGRTKDCSRMDS